MYCIFRQPATAVFIALACKHEHFCGKGNADFIKVSGSIALQRFYCFNDLH